jgi:hypothetical protein
VSVHRIYIALEPSLDGKEPTAFQAVVLSLGSQSPGICSGFLAFAIIHAKISGENGNMPVIYAAPCDKALTKK